MAYNPIKESPIHKGLVLQKISPGLVKVWIPTANSSVPNGSFKYIGSNTGSALSGAQYQRALATSYTCRVATKLTEGSWLKSLGDGARSLFGSSKHDKPYDYRIYGSTRTNAPRGTSRISYSTENPAANYVPTCHSLGEIGGTPVESVGNMPPGDYPDIEANQWVLVAFVNASPHPIVFASLPGEQEWQAALKK